MPKNSFILYTSDLAGLDYLTDAQAGKLFKAIHKFTSKGTVPALGSNPAVNILYHQITAHITINERKYEELCAKRASAAKKRWSCENGRNMQLNASDCKSMQVHTSECIYDNDIDNDNDNVNDIVNDNDACGAKAQNKRKKYYKKDVPALLQGEPSYDIDAFTKKAIGLKFEKKEKDNPEGLS